MREKEELEICYALFRSLGLGLNFNTKKREIAEEQLDNIQR